MAMFKTQPIGSAIAGMGIDWSDVANRVANELGADEYRISYLYGSSRPANALNPLALQRVRFAFEKLGTGGALPVLSFFGTNKTWVEAAEIVIRALGYEPSEEWGSVLDANDNPIRVIAHSGSKLCFAVNVYGPTRSDLESRSVETAEADTDEAADGDGDNVDADGDMELEFGD
jgi:hypothetical protein